MILKGSCLCGTVRYEIRGPLLGASHCHCSMCRKAHGAAFGSYARVAARDFRYLQGEDAVVQYQSSAGVTHTFCGTCGATLQWLADARLEVVTITLGTLDDDPGIRPDRHIFVADKAPWFEIHDALPQHAQDG